MAEPESSGAAPFRLILTGPAREAMREAGKRAKQSGTGASFTTTLRELQARLQAAPLDAGEPACFLKYLGLQVRAVGHGGLAVRFAVDEARRVVYVVSFFTSGSASGGQATDG